MREVMSTIFFLWAFMLILGGCFVSGQHHTENFAVIVSTSRFYFNYRHSANAVALYNYLKNVGNIPDSNIILMLADDLICNARNPLPGQVYMTEGSSWSRAVSSPFSEYHSPDDLFVDVDIDYKADDVTVENFVRVLTGKHLPGEANKKKLNSHANGNVLVYMAGHGGDGFIKFQDQEEITTSEITDVFEEMRQSGRFNELLFVVDTCQAFTLCDDLARVPNVIGIGSSLRGENSYAHHTDFTLGVTVVDQFTRELLVFLDKNMTMPGPRDGTISDFVTNVDPKVILAHPGVTDKSSYRKIHEVPMKDFFRASSISAKAKVTQEEVHYPDLAEVIATQKNSN
mmetsp:Transcript_15572/g.24208  ORF Transcript_15572/g.24208 Transcript_15572/m.24208 type:complete len:342 (-) Transcript_15572:355-1380(-)